MQHPSRQASKLTPATDHGISRREFRAEKAVWTNLVTSLIYYPKPKSFISSALHKCTVSLSKRYKSFLLWLLLWVSCFYGAPVHEIKCFPPPYLSYVNLIIRPAEGPGRKGGAAPPPFRLVTMPPRQCLLCAGPWPMYGQWKTGEPGPCLSPTGKGEESVPLLLQQALEIIKYFKISVFHWELDQCERAVFFGCHFFMKTH